MKTYSKYFNNEDHNWYDSSNIVYSVCFDKQSNTPKDLKIVFKGGRTYLYTGVDPVDYVLFREAESQGKVFNEKIKHYDCTKLNDTNLDSLQKLQDKLKSLDNRTEYRLSIALNNETGEFKLSINDDVAFQGIEGQVSIINLFTAMGFEYEYHTTTEHNTTSEDFINENIIK